MERSLPVKLTVEELQTKAREMSDLVMECEDQKDVKADTLKQFNRVIKDLQSQISDHARVIRAGQEFRSIECTERFVFETNTVEVYRWDTQERIEVRAMTADEREFHSQKSIFEDSETEDPPKRPEPS